ncbi:hypothetical protein [Nocardioides sp.]|uniref:hypothetical protein n=1 Tax=Nocardioides sp. TaxID=35761 RepID=UPI00286C63A4|nr:hypothetical protein [Nocardioides sp.]
MAARPTDRIVSVAAEVLSLGRTAGIKAARAAQPFVARAVGAVRTRVEPPVSPPPTLSRDAPAPTAPPANTTADTTAETTPDTTAAVPTPRTVAKNISPHPPAAQPAPGTGTDSGASAARKRTSAPGAKLPVRKPSPGPEAGA